MASFVSFILAAMNDPALINKFLNECKEARGNPVHLQGWFKAHGHDVDPNECKSILDYRDKSVANSLAAGEPDSY